MALACGWRSILLNRGSHKSAGVLFYLVGSHRQWEHIDQHAHSVHRILRYEDVLFHESAESRGVGGHVRSSLAHRIIRSGVGFA